VNAPVDRGEARLGPRGWLPALTSAVIVVAVLVAFWPSIHGQFVEWDDLQNFVDNQAWRGLGVEQLKWALTTYIMGVFQPVAWLLLELQYEFFGDWPGGYHLVSLGFHAANSVLLFLLLGRLLRLAAPDDTARAPVRVTLISGAVALLFAVHPVRTETVAWASCQPYQPAFFFSLLALHSYLRVQRRPSLPGWTLVFALTAAAMASKSVAVPLPLLFLVLDAYPLRRLSGGTPWWNPPDLRRVSLEKVPVAALALFFAVHAGRAKAASNSLADLRASGLGERLSQAAYAILFYPAKTLLPRDVSPYYPLPENVILGGGRFLLCFLVVLAVTGWVLKNAQRFPPLAAGWIAYLIALAPNSGLVRISEQIAADRYAYFSGFALAALATALLWKLTRRLVTRQARLGSIAAVGVAACLLIGSSRAQSRVWSSTDSLWTYAFQTAGAEDTVLRSNYAALLINNGGDLHKALEHLDVAVKLQPKNANAQRNRAAVLFRLKRYAEAIEPALRAADADPNLSEALFMAGLSAIEAGQLEAAVPILQRYLTKREDPRARIKLGSTLFTLGRHEEATFVFERAVELEPGRAEPHMHLGWAYFKSGQANRALPPLQRALELAPSDAGAHYHMGEVLLAADRREEGMRHLERALQLQPDFAPAKEALARERQQPTAPSRTAH
jgi:protein O-mannosyl-transferase